VWKERKDKEVCLACNKSKSLAAVSRAFYRLSFGM
jgi:hypothetical protein